MSAELQAWRAAGPHREASASPAVAPREPSAGPAAAAIPSDVTSPQATRRGVPVRAARHTPVRWAIGAVAAGLAFVAVPHWASDYWLSAILIQWVLVRFSWLSNDSASGVITAPPLVVAGVHLDHPAGRYLLTLSIVAPLTLLARNLVHSATGRRWQAVRDHETAAALMGVPVGATKVLAFAISSFYLGVAGALWAFAYLGTVEPHGFDLTRSFEVLFIAILGGLGSLSGAFLGAAVIGLLPIALSHASAAWLGGAIDPGQLQNLQKILFGALIIAFLIKEPRGLAHALTAAVQRLRGRGGVRGLQAGIRPDTRPVTRTVTPSGTPPHERPDALCPAGGPSCPG